MTEELKSIAVAVIEDHARDVEFLSITEMFEDLSDEEAEQVYDLIRSARIEVTWEVTS